MPKWTTEQLQESRRRRADAAEAHAAWLAAQPAYVPGQGIRVTLTRELPVGPHDRYTYFIGERDGTPIRYHCLDVAYIVAIRRGISKRGRVVHDAPSSWLDLATPEELEPDPLSRLHDAVLTGRAGGAMDGAA